jgi:hypothetical protein
VLGATTGDKGGTVPLGYVRVANGVRVDRDSAELVRRIFEWKRRGDSLRKIAVRLRASGRPAPRGGEWCHQTVAVILANREAYRGGKRGVSARTWPVILGKHVDIA